MVGGTDLGAGEIIDAISGGPIEVTRYGDRIVAVDGSNVLRAINYEYGVIYVIDRVLIPDDQILIDEYGLDTIEWGSEEEGLVGEGEGFAGEEGGLAGEEEDVIV